MSEGKAGGPLAAGAFLNTRRGFSRGLLALAAFWPTGVRADRTEPIADGAPRQTDPVNPGDTPGLFFTDFKLVKYDRPGGKNIQDPVQGSLSEFIRPLINVKNEESTEMQMVRVCIDWRVAKDLPSDRVYENARGMGGTIAPSQRFWVLIQDSGIQLNDEQLSRIESQKASLWVYGFLSYFDDATDEIVSRGYAVQWDVGSSKFIPRGLDNYVYETREKVHLPKSHNL